MPLAQKMLLEFLYKIIEEKLWDRDLLPFVNIMKCAEDLRIIVSLRNWPVIAIGERDITRAHAFLTGSRPYDRSLTPLIKDCKENLELVEDWSAANIDVINPKLDTEEFEKLGFSAQEAVDLDNIREGSVCSDQKDFGKATYDLAKERCESVHGDEKLSIPPSKKYDTFSDALTDRARVRRSEDSLLLDSGFEHNIGMRRIKWKILRIMLNHPRNARKSSRHFQNSCQCTI